MERNNKKWHETLKKKYGDENYNLFGSQSFKDNLKKKYGDEHYNNRKKAKLTLLEKYGVDHNLKLIAGSEHSKKIWEEQGDIIRNKIKETSLKKYGYDSPNKDPNKIKTSKETLIKHYGSLEEAYKQKYELNKKTKLQKYGDENFHNKEQASQTLEIRHLTFEKENNCLRYTKVLQLYGQGWKSLNIPIIYSGRFRYISNEYIPQIKKYSEENHNVKEVSKQEIELYNFIKSCTKYRVYKTNKNIIKDKYGKYDLDIYIPKLHLAFEYNGTYWHSTKLKKNKYYHQNKTKLCYNKGIQLIHIWEYDWINNNEQIKKQIKELLQGNDCSKYNWISLNDYNNYILSEPEKIQIGNLIIFNEGKFIKK